MSVRLSVRSLEDRTTPATFTVNALTDTGAGSGNAGDLRYCVTQANVNSGDDTIVFDAAVFGTPQTIGLSGTQLDITDTTGTTTITGPTAGVTISGNNASRVIEVLSGASADLSVLTITGGNASFGGGVRNLGTASLMNCTITGNTAIFGGGVYSRLFGGGTRMLTLTNCTVSGNTATSVGGGVYNTASVGTAVATLTNCTVSGNTANFGGGVSNNAAGGTATLFFVNCTVSENTAPNGGGVYSVVSGSGTAGVNLTNTIVARNTTGGGSPSDIGSFGGTVTGTNNLIGDASTAGGLADGVNNNLVGVADPGLSALGNYGGPVSTIALLPGSPAADAGTSTAAPATDARGTGRVGGVDIGAFESRGFTLAVAGADSQSATVNTPFIRPLVVTLTANDPGVPVDGTQVTFTAPVTGASATITGNPATIAGGNAAVTAAANATPGTYTVTAGVPGEPGVISFTLTNTLPPPPAPTGIVAVGAGAGGGPRVRVFDSGGVERFSFYAYGPEFSGGVNVATGDVTGDGVEDIVTGAGAGGGPHVKVFDGVTGAVLRDFSAFEAFERGGVFVAVGDADGDGDNDIITGAGVGGGPRVRAFDFADVSTVQSYFAFPDSEFRGGVTVAFTAGFIVAGRGPGGLPEVSAFSIDTGASTVFLAYEDTVTGGVYVAAGSGLIVTGPGNGSPRGRVFTPSGGSAGYEDFVGFDGAGNGLRVGLGGTAAVPTLLLGYGGGGDLVGNDVEEFLSDRTILPGFNAFDPDPAGGVFVG